MLKALPKRIDGITRQVENGNFTLGFFTLQESKEEVLSKIDFLGILLLSFSILSIMFAINNLGQGSLLNASVLGLLLLGVAIFAALIVVEKRSEQKQQIDPILPYSLLRKTTYSVTMIMALLSGTFIGAIIFIPSFAEQILGIPAAKSGYWMTPLALASGIGAGGGGYFVDKQGPVRTLIMSGIISIIGFGGLSLFTDTKVTFIIFSVIAGIGFGFVLGAPLTVLTSNAAGTQKGSALGTLSVARQIGLTISPTVFGAMIQRGFSQIGDIIPEKLQEHGVDPAAMPPGSMESIEGTNYSDIQSAIAKIPSTDVQDALREAFSVAAHRAYEPIYMTTAIAAVLLILLAVLFRKKFRADAAEDAAREAEAQSGRFNPIQSIQKKRSHRRTLLSIQSINPSAASYTRRPSRRRRRLPRRRGSAGSPAIPVPLSSPSHTASNCSPGSQSMRARMVSLVISDLNMPAIPKMSMTGMPMMLVSMTVRESRPSSVPMERKVMRPRKMLTAAIGKEGTVNPARKTQAMMISTVAVPLSRLLPTRISTVLAGDRSSPRKVFFSFSSATIAAWTNAPAMTSAKLIVKAASAALLSPIRPNTAASTSGKESVMST